VSFFAVSVVAGRGVVFIFEVSFLVVSLLLAVFDELQPTVIEPINAAIKAKFKIVFFIVVLFIVL